MLSSRLASLALALLTAVLTQACAVTDGLARGAPAPELPVTTWLSADATSPESLADLRGKHVLVEFWSSRCAACVASLTDMERIARDYCCTKLAILSVHVPLGANHVHEHGHRDAVVSFLADRPLPYPVGIDTESKSPEVFSFRYLPHAVLVDPSGDVAWSGSLSVFDVESAVSDALGEEARVTAERPTPAACAVDEACPLR